MDQSTSATIHELQTQLDATRAERNLLHAQLTDMRLDALEKQAGDHEKRIRSVEEVATKFNFLMALSIGGGAVSVFVLIRSAVGF
jgi:hypothetical protein